MTDATLLTDRGRPAIRLERHLADPPDLVWQALTEPEQLRSWFPCEVIVAGGRCRSARRSRSPSRRRSGT
jgi:uncharacterized protein YndB with AHSA1/START domain